MTSYLAFVVTGLLVHAPAPTPKVDPVEQEMKKLQGQWCGVSVEIQGDDKSATTDHSLLIDKDRFTWYLNGEVLMKGTFVLLPAKEKPVDSSKQPICIDLTVVEAKNLSYKGKVIVGIYEVKGETFRLCYMDPLMRWKDGKRRPREMSVAWPNPGVNLWTFKRKQP
jgi:uncharacterized protein (TIGR03067 family)